MENIVMTICGYIASKYVSHEYGVESFLQYYFREYYIIQNTLICPLSMFG